MSKTRAQPTEATRRFIIAKSAGKCNICKLDLFNENCFSERARLGDDAHIIAASNIGPRGNPARKREDLNQKDNLILLCKNCHAKVDQQVKEYPEEKLLQYRSEHYAWVDRCLGSELSNRPKFHYLSYINVPRADMYAAANFIPLPSFDFGNAQTFRDLGFDAGRIMAAYTQVLNQEELYANELDRSTKIGELEVGSYWFSPPANFRSKKISNEPNPIHAWEKQESIIYRKFGDWKLLCLIDPKWITTSTSYSTMSSGTMKFTGIVNIKEIDTLNKTVIASPLFLGAPDGWRI